MLNNVGQNDAAKDEEQTTRIRVNVKKDERPPSDTTEIGHGRGHLKDKCNQLQSLNELQSREIRSLMQEQEREQEKEMHSSKAEQMNEKAGSWQDNLQSNVVCLTIRKHCKNFYINHSARRSSFTGTLIRCPLNEFTTTTTTMNSDLKGEHDTETEMRDLEIGPEFKEEKVDGNQ